MADADDLPFPLGSRLAVLKNLLRQAEPETCATLRDVEAIVADTLSLVEDSLSIEAAAQSAILDCSTFADELMNVGTYWADAGNLETLRAQALAAVHRLAVALRGAAPSPAALARNLGW